MSDSGYSPKKVLAILVPLALAVIAVALTIGLTSYHASIAKTKANKELGTICVEAGGSWVRGYSDFQCIAK